MAQLILSVFFSALLIYTTSRKYYSKFSGQSERNFRRYVQSWNSAFPKSDGLSSLSFTRIFLKTLLSKTVVSDAGCRDTIHDGIAAIYKKNLSKFSKILIFFFVNTFTIKNSTFSLFFFVRILILLTKKRLCLVRMIPSCYRK